MGTWDIGPFDNDTAADWCHDLDGTAPDLRHRMIRETLVRAADATDHLDAPIAEKAVAAAASVAAQCPGGEPVCRHYGPRQPLPGLTDLRTLALEALDRVMTEPSDLLESWAETDRWRSWRTSADRIRDTLAPGPAGEQLRLP